MSPRGYVVLVAYNGECCMSAHAALVPIRPASSRAKAEEKANAKFERAGLTVNRDETRAYTMDEIRSSFRPKTLTQKRRDQAAKRLLRRAART